MVTNWERVAVCCQLAGKNPVSVSLGESLGGGGFSAIGSDGSTTLGTGQKEGWVDPFGLPAEGLEQVAKMDPFRVEDIGGKIRFDSANGRVILSKLPAPPQQMTPPTGNPIMGLSREFLGAVSRVRHAVAAKGYPRPIMEGIHLTPWRGQMFAVATDSRRMAAAPLGQAVENWITTLPVGVFDLLGRVWGDEPARIYRHPNGWWIEAENGVWRLQAAPYEGRFPNPLKIFDELEGAENGVEWEVETEPFRDHLERAKPFGKTENGNSVSIEVGPETWAITSESQLGSYRGEGSAKASRPNFRESFTISPIFLSAFVRRVSAAKLAIKTTQPNKPILFKAGALSGIISRIEPPTAKGGKS